MSKALANASRLKPEIRLAQAISEFEASLSSEQKASFHAHRDELREKPPNLNDVMRLTAEVDRQKSGNVSGGRCIGPRLTNFLHGIQQFAALGDVVIGGTQSLLACGVWSLVRMSLLVCFPSSTLTVTDHSCTVVDCEPYNISRKAFGPPHDGWSVNSPFPSTSLTLPTIQTSTIATV